MSASRFHKVTPDRPCEICGKGDWCRRSDDGCAECHREHGDAPGFRLLKVTRSGFGIYRPNTAEAGKAAQSSGRRELPSNGNGRTWPTPEAYAATLGGTHAGTWLYRNANGAAVLAVVRVDKADGKTFRPLHPIGDGWAVGDPPGPLPLYNLPALPADGRAFVVEGEKCADAARSIGLTVTTSAHGARSAKLTDWTPLAGRDVTILPDADAAGEQYAADVAAILTQLDPPATVCIVRLPDLPAGGDIVNWLDARECIDPNELRRGIVVLADRASPVSRLPLAARG